MPLQTGTALGARAIQAASDALKRLLGSRANDSAAVRDHHSHGESYHVHAAPDIVCFPHTTDEVAEIVRISAAHQVPVIPFDARSRVSVRDALIVVLHLALARAQR